MKGSKERLGDCPQAIMESFNKKISACFNITQFVSPYGVTPIYPYVSKKRANSIGEEAYYAQCFKYDQEQDTYTCPAGATLVRARVRKNEEGEFIGYD